MSRGDGGRVVFLVSCTLLLFCLGSSSPARRIESSTESGPAVTNEGLLWDDSEDFDLEDSNDGDWGRSPSPSPVAEYEEEEGEEYEDEEPAPRTEGDEDFLFVPPKPRDTRLLLRDDEDLDGAIKVRHTGKGPLSDNSIADASSDDGDRQQMAFSVDDDRDEDLVLEDDQKTPPQSEDDGDGDEPVFEGPEEDSQVIYGEHVFLY